MQKTFLVRLRTRYTLDDFQSEFLEFVWRIFSLE